MKHPRVRTIVRRIFRVSAWSLCVALVLLLIVWIVSTRCYVYANVVKWNDRAREGYFAGFTGGCLVSGMYPSSFMYTEEFAIHLTIAFHARWRREGWGLTWPSRAEQQKFVLAIMKEQKRFFDIYTPDLRIIEENCTCLPLWMPACGLAAAATLFWFLSRAKPHSVLPVVRIRPRRMLRMCKYASVASCGILAALWAINVVGTRLHTRLTFVSVTVERGQTHFFVRLNRGGIHLAYESQTISPPRFEISFDDAPYLPRDAEIYGLDLPKIWSTLPFATAPAPSVGNVIRIPIWLLLAPTAILTAVLFFIDRIPRRKKGLCVCCGYDLQGNTSGVCPECGQPTASTA